MTKHVLDPYRDVIVGVITKQLFAALLVEAPWAALPVIGFFIQGTISSFVRLSLDSTILGINLTWIAGETAIDAFHFKNALAEYRKLQLKGATKGDLDEQEKKIIAIGFDLIDLTDNRL